MHGALAGAICVMNAIVPVQGQLPYRYRAGVRVPLEVSPLLDLKYLFQGKLAFGL